MDKKKLTIYFIATSSYKDGLALFIKNIHLFLPQMEKKVIVLSDGLEEYNDKEINGVKYKVYHIDHYHWPVCALFKLSYILNHFDFDADYICYFNANLQVSPLFSKYEDVFDLTKINMSYHANLGENVSNFKCLSLDDDNPKSKSYIGNANYKYIQSGFFIGPKDLLYKACIDIDNWLKEDLKNNIIPKWHDESYLNKWCLVYHNLVHKGRFMNYLYFREDVPTCIMETIKKPRNEK